MILIHVLIKRQTSMTINNVLCKQEKKWQRLVKTANPSMHMRGSYFHSRET